MQLKRGVLVMARSFPVTRPSNISNIGGELVDVQNEALRRLRLPEAVPEFENFITSAFGKRKQKHQDAITLNQRQKAIDFMENLYAQTKPYELMERHSQVLPSYADPSKMTDFIRNYEDPGVGLEGFYPNSNPLAGRVSDYFSDFGGGGGFSF